MSIKQPSTIILQTNIAIIQYKIGKKCFEIACYKNKAINWRNQVEKDIEEVLQSQEIFQNTSHGEVWKFQEIKYSFPGQTKMQVIHEILEQGQLQIGDKQRESQTSNIYNDIVNLIAEMCVHPQSNRPFSVDSISQAIKDIHFPVQLEQSAQKQALACIRELKTKYIIARAEMKVKITVPSDQREALESILTENQLDIKEGQFVAKQDTLEHTRCIEPALFRILNQSIKERIKNGAFELLSSNMANRETQGLEDAGTVNLEVRSDWQKGVVKSEQIVVDEDEEEEEREERNQNKKSKSKQKKANPNAVIQKNDVSSDEEKNLQEEQQETKEEKQLEIPKEEEASISTAKFQCSHCKGAFFERSQDHQSHYKSEWHSENLKRQGTQKAILDEKQFELFQLDLQFSDRL